MNQTTTTIYLIRHSKTLPETGIRNTDETDQIINEKEILSIEGEKLAAELSQNIELRNLDAIWCSSYARAKQTAKYIAYENNLNINIDSRLNERKLGNMDEIAEIMKDKDTRDVSKVQLTDETKTSENPISCVVWIRSIGKDVPNPAPEPNGFWSAILKAASKKYKSVSKFSA